jgi:hypothetical protein
MNKQVHLTTALALATAILSIPTLAIAQPTGTVEIEDTASLLAKGAAVLISAEVTCDPTTTYKSLSVQLTQRVGNQVVQGFNSTDAFVCDGTPQTVELAVSASNRPFRKGAAVAQATLFACDEFFFCENVATDTEEIEIVSN